MPKAPLLEQNNCGDFSIPADALIDRWDWELSTQRFLGDSFPSFPTHQFGPGVIAAYLGATLDTSTGNVWYLAPRTAEPPELHFEYDADNTWFKRTKEICRAAVDRWQGSVQINMTDLGGTMDILHSFLPGERLALDLMDYPEDVKRLTWELHDLWWRYFDEFNELLQPTNPGYTAWTPILSDSPYYMLQCDFAYNIGPRHFDEFVKPELEAMCRRLERAFYHLDGIGQLVHLPSLLGIERLRGIQWVPGAGKKPEHEWPEVFATVLRAGKRTQFFHQQYDWAALDKLLTGLGTGKGVMVICSAHVSQEMETRAFLARYGACTGE